MRDAASSWPPPEGSPAGTSGWYLADDLQWYRSDVPPAAGYRLGDDGRWHGPIDAAGTRFDGAWRWSRWGLGDVWWCVLAYVAAGIGGALLYVGVDAATGGDGNYDETPLALAVFVGLNAVATFGVVWMATRRKGLRSLRDDFGLRMRRRDPFVGIGMAVAGLVGAGVVGWAIDEALGADETSSNLPVDDLVTFDEFAVFFVAVALVTPVVEELVFRGLLYRSLLKRGHGRARAIVTTTLLFVVPHLPAADSWTELASLAGSIGVLGLAFNLACHWTGNRLAAPIVAHTIVNGLAAVTLYAT